MLNWLRNKLSRETKLPAVIFIDIGYACYQLCEALTHQQLAQPSAFIDEEPWSHLTTMLDAKLHYPNEIIALSQKHNVQIVIKFIGLGWEPTTEIRGILANLNITLLQFEPLDTLDQQLAAVQGALSPLINRPT